MISVVVLCWNLVVVAAAVRHDRLEVNAVQACASMLNKLSWDFEPGLNYFSTLCEYEPALGSWSICVSDVLEDSGLAVDEYFNKSFETVGSICSSFNVSLEQYTESLHNASRYLQPFDRHSTLHHPVSVDKTLRTRVVNAFHCFTGNLDRSDDYSVVLCAYVGIVLLICACFRFFDLTAINAYLFRYKFMNYIRGYVALPTLNGTHSAEYKSWWCLSGLLPSRLETCHIACFFLLNIVLLSTGYEVDHYNVLFDGKLVQLCRYVGDRSGTLAIAHFPLIILFSTRSNFVECLTGFKYSTLIALHKWIGRIMVFDVLVHSIAYTAYALLTHSFLMSMGEWYFRFGVLATLVLVLLSFWSLGYIRKNHYEVFLYLHIFMAVAFFFSCWKHIQSIGWTNWIYISLAIWIFERLIRIIRILHFGVATANIQLIGKDLLRVTIPKKSQFMKWRALPGQYVFLHFMDPMIFWQSHPFTVIDSGDELVVVLRAKKGATNVVLKRVIEATQNSSDKFFTKMKVCVEGPYGTTSPLHLFNNVLFLCGGSGLPGPLAHAIELSKSLKHKGVIDMVIAVRSLDILEAYINELLELQRSQVHLQIFVTRSAPTAQYGSISSNIHEQAVVPRLKPFATFHVGRPDLQSLINNSLSQNGPLAILTCGPPVFVDKARDITASTIVKNPTRVIEYFEEYQCW